MMENALVVALLGCLLCLAAGFIGSGSVLFMYVMCVLATLMKAGFKQVGIFTAGSISTAFFPISTIVVLVFANVVHHLVCGNQQEVFERREISAITGTSAYRNKLRPPRLNADERKAEAAKRILGDVRMVAACTDAKSTDDGGDGGCTDAFIAAMGVRSVFTWEDLLLEMQSRISMIWIERARKNNKKPEKVVPVVSMSSKKFKVSEKIIFKNSSGGGRTRSLLIGIHYDKPKNEDLFGVLTGCYADVKNMKKFIKSQGYSVEKEDCKTLMDDGEQGYPSKQRIRDEFKWLVKGAVPGDSLFFFFAGHGTHIKDLNGDEDDGRDEAIVPAGCKADTESELLIDDVIFEELVVAVPKGVTLTAVVDCCSSGTILDLPYSYPADKITGIASKETSAEEYGRFLMQAG